MKNKWILFYIFIALLAIIGLVSAVKCNAQEWEFRTVAFPRMEGGSRVNIPDGFQIIGVCDSSSNSQIAIIIGRELFHKPLDRVGDAINGLTRESSEAISGALSPEGLKEIRNNALMKLLTP